MTRHNFIKTDPTNQDSNQTYLTTPEFSALFKVKPETVRRNLCTTGHFMGVKPLKMPNGRLLWPAGTKPEDVAVTKSEDVAV